MKIIHISMGFPVEFQGGITNYVRMLAREQANSGNEVIVYCNGSEPDIRTTPYLTKRYNSNIRPFTLNVTVSDPTFKDFYNALINENADIYHIHSLLGVDVEFAELFSNSKLNYVVSLHDYNFICPRVFMTHKNGSICHDLDLARCENCIGEMEQFDFILRVANKLKLTLPTFESKKNYARYDKFKKLLVNAKKILPVSTRVGEIFSSTSISNQQVITIGNDTAIRQGQPEKNFGDTINVAFLGSFTRIKGAELFIELCRKNKNKNMNFLFYGRGDKKLLAEFEAVGGKNYGSYSADTLPTILKNIHVGAVLSIWEDNGPQVVMELINQSIPVLGTQRGGIPDFVNTSNGFIFDPAKELSLASEWLSNLTVDSVRQFYNNIQPLKTPAEHEHEIMELYKEITI